MNHIQNIIDALNKFDDTPHGQTGKLLDQMMKDAEAALKEWNDPVHPLKVLRSFKGRISKDAHGDGYCGCTERCKDRDNCQYDDPTAQVTI